MSTRCVKPTTPPGDDPDAYAEGDRSHRNYESLFVQRIEKGRSEVVHRGTMPAVDDRLMTAGRPFPTGRIGVGSGWGGSGWGQAGAGRRYRWGCPVATFGA